MVRKNKETTFKEFEDKISGFETMFENDRYLAETLLSGEKELLNNLFWLTTVLNRYAIANSVRTIEAKELAGLFRASLLEKLEDKSNRMHDATKVLRTVHQQLVNVKRWFFLSLFISFGVLGFVYFELIYLK